MKYCSLNNTSLSYFTAKSGVSELSGSSAYNVHKGIISKKPKAAAKSIENTTAIQDYLLQIIETNQSDHVMKYALKSLASQLVYVKNNPNCEQKEIQRLDDLLLLSKKYFDLGAKYTIDYEILKHHITQLKSRYQTKPTKQATEYRLNKSKVKQKLFALFNLKHSKKFIAFITVSFPAGTSDNETLTCWNYFLTACRKRYELTNYLWIAERQKNGTIHYHMLTNNRLPVQNANKAMAIIINNRVKAGAMSWGNSSFEKYNGLDIDSVYGSKRHKKSGKTLQPSELRNWITQYVTKYVSKNNEVFNQLAWHCSHSVSQLFTAQIYDFNDRLHVVNQLPTLAHMYEKYKSDFNITYMFKFVPIDSLFDKIRIYNDLISGYYTPNNKAFTKDLTHKSINL